MSIDSINKFLEEERYIAKYKLELLKKGPDKVYKARLIKKEAAFIDYPFEDLGLESLGSARDAVLLFRADSHLFFEKYSNKSFDKKSLLDISDILDKKISFYNNLYKNLLEKKIQSIALARRQSGGSNRSLPEHTDGIDSISSSEGVFASKARARIQILIYCLARTIYHRLSHISKLIDAGEASGQSNLRIINSKLDDLLLNVRLDIFGHYNNGRREAPLLVNGTIGHNNFINTIYPLIDVFEKHPGSYFLKRTLDQNKLFFNSCGNPVYKRFVERGFSIVTPINRVGNEAANLLYADIWSSNEVRVTEIIENKFFNHKYGGEYFKAISTKPIWDILGSARYAHLNREISIMIGGESPSLDYDLGLKSKINSCSGPGLPLSSGLSKMLIGATRSETLHIRDASAYIDLLIYKIKDEYKDIFK